MAAFMALIGGLMMACPRTASAHPGHGIGGQVWGHWLLSPDHLLIPLAMGAVFFLLGAWVQRRLARRVLRWGGVAVAFASLILICLQF
jgi:hypothetical protein